MIKIIEPSQKSVHEKPKKRKFIITCDKCGCVFECEPEDIQYIRYSKTDVYDFWVNCPENHAHVLSLDVELFGLNKENGRPELGYAKCTVKEE